MMFLMYGREFLEWFRVMTVEIEIEVEMMRIAAGAWACADIIYGRYQYLEVSG